MTSSNGSGFPLRRNRPRKRSGARPEREAQRVRTSLKLSNLPVGQTLENFDFAFQPAIGRSRIDTLATCAWAGRRRRS
ncbi:hypothetical protein E4O86_09170 [Rhizobiales bacterium L72]|uniref:IstB-like ATP-binding domain-containing protein n=1 Tax=Propylenella binzhouense TaxID=2555902 RepID=A0A964T3U1_9HYPH|nr:hypothetical protein [Propylenella binzhouense]